LELSEQVQVAMRDVTALKAQYDFLK